MGFAHWSVGSSRGAGDPRLHSGGLKWVQRRGCREDIALLRAGLCKAGLAEEVPAASPLALQHGAVGNARS